MTLEELRKEKRELGLQISKLIREFEEKYNCHAELQQHSGPTMTTITYRTITVEVEIHV